MSRSWRVWCAVLLSLPSSLGRTVRIGYILPIFNRPANKFQSTRQLSVTCAALVAAQHVNAREESVVPALSSLLGNITLEVSLQDSGYEEATAIQSYRQTLADGSHAIVGPSRSAVSQPLAQLGKVDRLPQASGYPLPLPSPPLSSIPLPCPPCCAVPCRALPYPYFPYPSIPPMPSSLPYPPLPFPTLPPSPQSPLPPHICFLATCTLAQRLNAGCCLSSPLFFSAVFLRLLFRESLQQSLVSLLRSHLSLGRDCCSRCYPSDLELRVEAVRCAALKRRICEFLRRTPENRCTSFGRERALYGFV